jgi:hypothetical protein
MMAHPEHEDPAMRDHDDEAAEMAAIKLGFEAAESALADAADAVGSALVDLTAADGLFELVPELTQCVRVLAMVQARVTERLAYLATVPGVASYATEQSGRHHGVKEDDRRLAGHPSERQIYSEFPHPFEPAESTAPSGRFARVPAGEGSGLYLGAPRESLVPPPAAPLVERDMVRDFARSVLAEPLVDLETMRPLWAEGADR